MSGGVLEPEVLGVITPWSAATWRRALDAARDYDVPESVVIDLVSKGATPWLIAGIHSVLIPFG